MNPLRKAIQKTGFDFHRYRPAPSRSRLWREFSIKTILDVGANVGQFALEARKTAPEAQIYSFEPLHDVFKTLEKKFEGDLKFRAFNFGIGENEVEIEMHKSAYTPSSSLLKMSQTHKDIFPHTKDHNEEKVFLKRLDNVVKDLNLEKEILIKVDVQGFEDRVIKGGLETFKKAKAVIMETSFINLYEGQPKFDDLYESLKSLQFEYAGSLEQKVDRDTSKIISEDSLFIKKS